MNTLSTELDKFGYGIVYGITREEPQGPTLTKSEASQAIYTDLMELVGEDEDEDHPAGAWMPHVTHRNELRAELRARIAEYCGVQL